MLPRNLLTDYRAGGIVIWPAFTSTTTNINVAQAFGGGGGGNDSTASVLFEIQNAPWCPVQDISVYPNESEILLPCFSCFTVVSVNTGYDEGRRAPVRITLKYEVFDVVRECLLQEETDESVEEDGTSKEEDDDNVGPIVITKTSELKGLAGVRDILESYLRKYDEHVYIRSRCYERENRVSGRAYFTSATAARKACSILDGSLLNDRQLSAKPAPVETESCAMRNRVIIAITGVPHDGIAFVDCYDDSTVQCIMDSGTCRSAQRATRHFFEKT